MQGRVFTDLTLRELQAEERRATYVALARTLAALHAVDPVKAGLGDYGRLTGYCARQVWPPSWRLLQQMPAHVLRRLQPAMLSHRRSLT